MWEGNLIKKECLQLLKNKSMYMYIKWANIGGEIGYVHTVLKCN